MARTHAGSYFSGRLLVSVASLSWICLLVGCSFSSSGVVPASTPPARQAVFHVSRVDLALKPAGYRGACNYGSVNVTVSATIVVPAGSPGGTVTYTWESDQNVPTPPTFSTALAPGVTTQAVQFFWIVGTPPGNDTLHWQEMHILSPNVLTSPRALFRISCQ